MFDVVVFLVCRRIESEGQRGPGSLARLPYTLEGVTYTFRFDDPSTEPPAEIGELWLYTRFSRTSPSGFRRRMGLRVFALDDRNRRTPVPYPADPPTSKPFDLGEFNFPDHSPVTSVPSAVRGLVLPRRGRYEFRLLVRRRRPHWRGPEWRHVASHYITVE
jgi:hypothetical protein